MRGLSRRMAAAMIGLVGLAMLPGCVLVADLANPDFLATLGFDPATVVPARGRVIVAFKNDTTGVAKFSALVAFSEEAASTGEGDVMLLAAQNVEAGETRTLVVDCPFVSINPLDFEVETTDSVAAFSYQGVSVMYGEDFSCGDIVEISIVAVVAEDGSLTYDNRVQVIPGR